MRKLVIKDLHVAVGDKEILKGIDLTVNSNEVHALMGPNGNGKSTLLNTLMGHPNYKVTQGEIYLDGQDVLSMSVDQRSKAGLFLALQYPSEISGVTNSDFLKAAVNAHRDTPVSLFKFIRELDGAISDVKLNSELAHRYVNEGFSGGEKKKAIIMKLLARKQDVSVILLDEIEAGLDKESQERIGQIEKELLQERERYIIVKISHGEVANLECYNKVIDLEASR